MKTNLVEHLSNQLANGEITQGFYDDAMAKYGPHGVTTRGKGIVKRDAMRELFSGLSPKDYKNAFYDFTNVSNDYEKKAQALKDKIISIGKALHLNKREESKWIKEQFAVYFPKENTTTNEDWEDLTFLFTKSITEEIANAHNTLSELEKEKQNLLSRATKLKGEIGDSVYFETIDECLNS